MASNFAQLDDVTIAPKKFMDIVNEATRKRRKRKVSETNRSQPASKKPKS